MHELLQREREDTQKGTLPRAQDIVLSTTAHSSDELANYEGSMRKEEGLNKDHASASMRGSECEWKIGFRGKEDEKHFRVSASLGLSDGRGKRIWIATCSWCTKIKG